jgi:hypothetical protein
MMNRTLPHEPVIRRRALRVAVAAGAALLLAWCFHAWLDPSVLLGLMSGLSFCG